MGGQLLHSIAVVNEEMAAQSQLGGGMASLFELAGALSRSNARHTTICFSWSDSGVQISLQSDSGVQRSLQWSAC
jgi:hypothetical protein